MLLPDTIIQQQFAWNGSNLVLIQINLLFYNKIPSSFWNNKPWQQGGVEPLLPDWLSGLKRHGVTCFAQEPAWWRKVQILHDIREKVLKPEVWKDLLFYRFNGCSKRECLMKPWIILFTITHPCKHRRKPKIKATNRSLAVY